MERKRLCQVTHTPNCGSEAAVANLEDDEPQLPSQQRRDLFRTVEHYHLHAHLPHTQRVLQWPNDRSYHRLSRRPSRHQQLRSGHRSRRINAFAELGADREQGQSGRKQQTDHSWNQINFSHVSAFFVAAAPVQQKSHACMHAPFVTTTALLSSGFSSNALRSVRAAMASTPHRRLATPAWPPSTKPSSRPSAEPLP